MKTEQAIVTNGDKRPLIERQLAIAIQFWEGDKTKALALAKLLADIEPERRDDVALIFAQRFDVQMSADIYHAQQYCARKFPIFHISSEREQTGHPNGCYGLWAGTAEQCYRHYCRTWPYHSVFFCEADGAPLRRDWIDLLKRRHAETLAAGKRITGHIVPENKHCCRLVDGTLLMHISCWADHPSLHTCRRDVAWDVFHAQTLLSEAIDNRAIVGKYGMRRMTRDLFEHLGKSSAWVSGIKDGSAMALARELVAPRLAGFTVETKKARYHGKRR